jgi:hypothetical protein
MVASKLDVKSPEPVKCKLPLTPRKSLWVAAIPFVVTGVARKAFCTDF